MSFLLALVVFPLLYLVLVVAMLAKRDRRGLGLSLLFAAIAAYYTILALS